MRIRLDQAREQAFSWREELALDAQEFERGELVELGSIGCAGELQFVRPGFLLRAQLRYNYTLSCFRCLQPTRDSAEYEFEVLLMPGSEGDAAGGANVAELQLEKKDLDIVWVAGEEVDILPLVYEQVQLNFPMKPLCLPTCRGLCSTCGADLNAGPCGCEAPADSRWAALAQNQDRLPNPPSRK